MSSSSFTIIPATAQDLSFIVSWASREGWNPGLCDADIFFATDPSGFFIGKLDNQPIASISAVKYSNDFGFVGFLIVDPHFRQHGYGIKMLQLVHDHLKDCTSIACDRITNHCFDMKMRTYPDLSYKYVHSTTRFVRKKGFFNQSNIPKYSCFSLKENYFLWDEIVAYDSRYFPVKRSVFMKHWIVNKYHVALGIKDQSGALAGYGVRRKCYSGYKIGPLFAENSDLAKNLFINLHYGLEDGESIYIDIPNNNLFCDDFVSCFDLKFQFETCRMYSRSVPFLNMQNIYGITSLELG